MEKAKYSVIQVSELIIYYYNMREKKITNLKLQKLLYFVQAYFLVEKNSICFSEEISAWRYGPVVEQAYHIYKFFGHKNIQLNNYDMILDIETQDFDDIIAVIDSYVDMPAWQIVEKSHAPGSPWERAYTEDRNIDLESVFEYFSERRSEILGKENC